MMYWLALSTPGHATWSIVAADSASGQLGGAGTSCVGELDVGIIFGSAPGFGAIHAQAYFSSEGRDLGAETLAAGASAEEVISVITDASADEQAERRQYGVVTLSGDAAAWTGTQNGAWAGDLQGRVDGITFSTQGNILTGAPVVSRTHERFEAGGACDLAERLLVSLTAGRAEGEGDSRCTDRGVPSDSAFVRVEDADGSVLVSLTVTGTRRDDPLDRLAEAFSAWRADNPCPGSEEEAEDETLDDDPAPSGEASTESGGGCGGRKGAALLAPAMLLGRWRRRR